MLYLNEYAETVAEKWDGVVIDELLKSNVLFDLLPWDDTVGSTGGSSFPYKYTRKVTESTAAFRTVGEEYTPSDAKTENVVAEVKILGGAYTIDRAVLEASEGNFINQNTFQMQEKVKGVKATFNDCLINGDSDVNEKEFDGLKKILTGSDTEFESQIDISTSKLVDENYTALIDEMDGVIAEMDGTPTVIAGNSKMISKIKAVARRAGQYQETKDDFGRTISHYGDSMLLDLGAKAGSSDPIVAIDENGKTDLYFIRVAEDAFHGITLKDGKILSAMEADKTERKNVLTGHVEMYGACVLKATKGAAVLRGIKVK